MARSRGLGDVYKRQTRKLEANASRGTDCRARGGRGSKSDFEADVTSAVRRKPHALEEGRDASRTGSGCNLAHQRLVDGREVGSGASLDDVSHRASVGNDGCGKSGNAQFQFQFSRLVNVRAKVDCGRVARGRSGGGKSERNRINQHVADIS
jgi:hypothetical protein